MSRSQMLLNRLRTAVFKQPTTFRTIMTSPLAATSFVRKPLEDHREYKFVHLSNKLQALVISDAKADKAAAAMDVRVGSLFDPPQYQGLAHFLEHMLFLGTTKYPSEDEYQSYLAKHGGSSNAFTADNHTCYFFNIAPEHLAGALDRFGQFFIAPLLTQSATDREVQAVHSEHSKNVQEDLWRQYQLMRTVFFNPSHPAHHFSTGNKETLGDIPREALLAFHEKWYSANVSRVCVLGKESVEELEKLVTDVFAGVPNKNVEVPIGTGFGQSTFVDAITAVNAEKSPVVESVSIPVVNQKMLGQELVVVPVKEQRSVQFCWFLPEQLELWKSKPARYLSHILGHEGAGSLTSVLKARGIATDLVGGLFYDCAGVALFKIDVQLTAAAAQAVASAGEGEGMLDEISKVVAMYTRLARDEFSHGMWKEMEVVDNLGFDFRATVDPMTAVQTTATAMHYYPESEVLAAGQKIYEFDQALISQHLAALTSEAMFMTSVGKEFAGQCDLTEKWYGTKYTVRPVRDVVLGNFKSVESMSNEELRAKAQELGLAMPLPNPFLPEDLSVKPALGASSASTPELVKSSGFSSIFFKQDTTFRLPKSHAAFAVYSPYVQRGLEQFTRAQLLMQCVTEGHSQKAYQADIAGLKYKLAGTSQGASLSVSGYSDKVGELVQSVMQQVQATADKGGVDASLFNLVKDRTVRNLQSQLLQKAPYSQAMDLVHQVIVSPFYSTGEKLGKVQETTVEELAGVAEDMFRGAIVESLVEGNLYAKDAEELSAAVVDGLRVVGGVDGQPGVCGTGEVGSIKVMKLGSGSSIEVTRKGVNHEETNGAVAISVEAGWLSGHVSESTEADLETAACLSLVSQICGQKFFDDLRTKQQLGYIVHAAANVQERRAGVLFLVQSEKPTAEVKQRMFEFVNKLDVTIGEITDEDFATYVDAVVTDLKEKPKNQQEEFQQHWTEIEKRRFDFERKERLVPVVKETTKAQLVEFVRNHVVGGPKVVATVAGSDEGEVQEMLSNDEIAKLRASAQWVQSNRKPVAQNSNHSKIYRG